MASGKNYPKLDLANNSYWLTKRGEIVGPFEETKFYTTKKLPVFKCKTTKTLYDVYGVEVRCVFEEYISYKRLKLTTIDKIAPIDIQQAMGRSNRNDTGTGKSATIIDLMSGKEVSADELGIPIHKIIEAITNQGMSGFIGKTGTPDLSLFSKGFNNPNISIINDDEYRLKLRKPQQDILHIDYEHLNTLCDCDDCKVAKQTLKNGIMTNVSVMIDKLHNYLTKILFVEADTIITKPDLTRLPVTFHHLYLLHLKQIFLDQDDTNERELDKILEDYDPGKYYDLMPVDERADIFLRSYNIVSKEYSDFVYDNTPSVLAERLELIAEILGDLKTSKKINVRFNTNWGVNATRLTMVETFLSSFIDTAPEFDTQFKITLTFKFASDEFNQDSFVIVNRNPSNILFETYYTDFYLTKNKLAKGEQPQTIKPKLTIKDYLETDFFQNFTLQQLNNIIDINGVKHLDYGKTNIKSYLQMFGIKTFRWPDASQAKNHLKRKLWLMVAERITNIISNKNIGITIAFNVDDLMNDNVWDNLKINEIGKIILFLDQLNYNVLTNMHTKDPFNIVVIFNFDFSHSVLLKQMPIENIRHYTTEFEIFMISMFNRIVKPIKESKLESIINMFNQMAAFKSVRTPQSIYRPTAWQTIFTKNDDKLRSIAAKQSMPFHESKIKTIKTIPAANYESKSFELKGRTIAALGNMTYEDIQNNPKLKEIVDAIGLKKLIEVSNKIPANGIWHGKKPFSKIITVNEPVTNDLIELANNWYANPANKKINYSEVEFPNWLYNEMNKLDFSKFVGYKNFQKFYYCLNNQIPCDLEIYETNYFPEHTNNILNFVFALINSDNKEFNTIVVKQLNHTTISIKPSNKL